MFALFIGGVHVVLWWGLYCYPKLNAIFLASYYCTAAACVVAATTATTSFKRAAPMFMLLCIRLAAVAARLMLRSGSHAASLHYIWMEVCSSTDRITNLLCCCALTWWYVLICCTRSGLTRQTACFATISWDSMSVVAVGAVNRWR